MTTTNTAKSKSPFSGIETRTTRPVTNAGPLLQWFNGLPTTASTMKNKIMACGWHIATKATSPETNKAMKKLHIKTVEIQHESSGNTVEYWSLETCSLLFLCNGFSDTWRMKSHPEEAQGLAYAWYKGRSKLKVQCLIAELCNAGDSTIFTITMESMITDEFLHCLEKMFEIQDAYETFNHQEAPFCGHVLTIAPATETKLVGKGKQSPILPFLTDVPTPITQEFLSHIQTPEKVLEKIRNENLLAKAVKWSIDTSMKIAAGEDREEYQTPEYEQAIAQMNHPAPAPQTAKTAIPDDVPASTQQLATIEKLRERYQLTGPIAKTFNEAKQIILEINEMLKAQRQQG